MKEDVRIAPKAPHSFEAEQALLSSLLLNPSNADRVASLVDPADFYIVRHGWVYRAILVLHRQGEPVDVLTVGAVLEGQKKLEECGGSAWLAGLTSDAPSRDASVEAYARIIRNTATRRRFIDWCGEAAKLALDASMKASDVLAEARVQLEDLAEGSAGRWDWRSLAQACEPKPDREYVVQAMIGLPSLNVIYGHPGDLKTMLAQDLALCVAAGRPWLQPLPGNPIVGSYVTQKSPVLWVDVDTGQDRLERRFAALAAGLNIPNDAPLHLVSFPVPPFVASSPPSTSLLLEAVRRFKARLVIIDNLGAVSGGADENSAEMINVMSGLRWTAEKGSCAVLAIHHKSKGDRMRAGDSLRGHSSIEGAIDLAIMIQRNEGSDVVTLRTTKSRDVPIAPFDALWSYTSEGEKLVKGRFFGLGRSEHSLTPSEKAENAILSSLVDGMNQSVVVDLVKNEVDIGRHTAIAALTRLVDVGKLATDNGPNNSILYFRENGSEPEPLMKEVIP